MRQGDRCTPLWCHWYAKETEETYGDRLRHIMDEYPDDVFVVDFLAGSKRFDDHPYWYGGEDEFGCTWAKSAVGVGGQVQTHILDDWSQLDEYLDRQFPAPTSEERDRFSRLKAVRERSRDGYILGRLFRTFADRLFFLRGMENALVDLYTQPVRVQKLLETLTGFTIELIQGFAKHGADGVLLGDDWGLQDRLLIRPELWRETFKPWYARMFAAAHEAGLQVWFHSCGNVLELVDDFIEIGMDVLNPLQSRALDLVELARRHRGRTAFSGGIDTQFTLTRGSPREVREEVFRIAGTLQTDRGGYIGGPCTTIMPETPLENITALCRAFREWRSG